MNRLVGAIIAGGTGSRMGALGRSVPKALLPVGDRPVIGHHLELLRGLGVDDVFIVVGHLGDALRTSLGDGSAHGTRITWIDQPEALGSAHALGRLRGLISSPFILILGDYFFVSSSPEKLVDHLERGHAAVTVQVESDIDLVRQACEVRADPSGRVTGLIEKPTRPRSSLKGCGVYALHPDVFDSVAVTPRTALRDEYELTHALDLYCRTGREVFTEPLFDSDTNLTAPGDILRCNMSWLERRGQAVFVADGASVGDELELSNVVVGAGARIDGSAKLTDVVVFPGVMTTLEADVNSSIITVGGLLKC